MNLFELRFSLYLLASAIGLSLHATSAVAIERETLRGHVPAAVTRFNLRAVDRLADTNRLHLTIGLPLRNQDALTNLLKELYDPASTNFHRYLNPEQFTEHFGPAVEDYRRVAEFARTNGLEVETHDDLVLLDLRGKVQDIERVFHVTLRTYQHPLEERRFFAPDVVPSVDVSLPLFEVNGLDNYIVPHPMARLKPAGQSDATAAGTAPDGSSYFGQDFRTAYAPGVTLNGSGQIVGLVEGDGFFANDILNYEALAGLPNVPLQVLPGALSGPSGNTNGVAEVSLDIEMVIAMAPGLKKIMIWEDNVMEDMLSNMSIHTEVSQFSSSWTFESATQTSEGYFMKMAAQGQSFFQASGDGDSYTQPIPWPSDDPYVTSTGGTTLTMSNSAAAYASEIVWNTGFQSPAWPGNGSTVGGGYWGSGGGVTTYPIPDYQLGINMSAVGGSSTFRNIPDVALTANQVWVTYFNGLSGAFKGTSCAAPLWAGFTALINQKAAGLGRPPVGFLNPALYSVGKGASYTNCFHDITTGNNTWPSNSIAFFAAAGYDLCTGWGTPNGQSLIDALVTFGGAVWVDFNYGGAVQNGAYLTPFKTLAQATNAIFPGGTIAIKTAGSTVETMFIKKPMQITAAGGSATIGH
jgi:subtilase family serine protease